MIAIAGEDYMGGMMVIGFSAEMLAQSFKVVPINDTKLECSETFNITIQSVTVCGVAIGSSNDIEMSIRDDDSKWRMNNNIFIIPDT